MTAPLGEAGHVPVLRQEVLSGLRPRTGRRFIDGTLGAGGHTQAILDASAPDGQVLALDADPQAVIQTQQRLRAYGDRVLIVNTNFSLMASVAREHDFVPVDGVLLDLGYSSVQLSSPGRGFSFSVEDRLDMRYSPTQTVTADELVNNLSQIDLADLLFRFGEERRSRAIARAIVAARPIETTTQLADIVARSFRGKRGKIHPATRTFQALRIAVNDELGVLRDALPAAVSLLAPGARIAVISFHSLEDRIVKEFFRQEARDCICPSEQPVCTCDHQATLHIISQKPIIASPQEVAANPRARSAKLRIAERKA
jgi:16S rRNA (cytosine1402-N4)-methyltransferase